MINRITLLVWALSFSFCWGACTPQPALNRDRLVVAINSSPNTLDPRFATDAMGMKIGNLIFSSIVRLGPELKIIGEAAENWKYQDLVYTFYLRKDLKFNDGSLVSADDLQFTFDEYRKPTSPFQSALKSIREIKIIEKEGQLVLTLKLSQYSATLLTDLTPVKVLSKKSTMADKPMLGTGPFRLEDQSSSEIVLSANPNYWVPSRPRIHHLIFKVVRDDNTRFLRIIKGDFDIVQGDVPLQKVQYLKTRKELEVFQSPGLSMTYLLINLKDPNFHSLQVRELLSSAIDRGEIIQYKLEGLGRPATSLLTPENPYFNKELSNTPFAPEKAKSVVESLGLKNQTWTIKSSNSPQAVENAKLLAHQLKKIGLKVQIQSFEWGTFYSDIQAGRFQLATMRWMGATDPDIYRTAFHSKELPPGRNRGSYQNPQLDNLLDLGVKMSNEEKRKQHYLNIQNIIQKDLPIIPLWYDDQVAVIHRRVQDYSPSLNGDFTPLVEVWKK